MCTIVLHPVTHFSFLFLVAVVVVIRYLAERTSRVDWDGIRYTLFGQPVYQHSIYDGLRHRPDKLGLKKPLIWCMSFILVLTGPFMIYVYEPLLQSNFSVGLILGALFFGLGYLAGCGLLDSFTEKWHEIFISNMEQRAHGDLLAMRLARSLLAYFSVSVPISTSGWFRYLALYL